MKSNLALQYPETLEAQAGNCLDIKVQIDTLQVVLDDFSGILRDEVNARGNKGFTIIVPGKGKVIARAGILARATRELKCDPDAFGLLPPEKQRWLLDSGVVSWVDEIKSARSPAISYQPNV